MEPVTLGVRNTDANKGEIFSYFVKLCKEINDFIYDTNTNNNVSFDQTYDKYLRFIYDYKNILQSLNSYISVDISEEILYCAVALVDEKMISTVWEGNNQWREKTLENYFFSTNRAGSIIIDRINHILSSPYNIPPDLIFIYLILLGYGFRGNIHSEKELKNKYDELTIKFGISKPISSLFTQTIDNTVPSVIYGISKDKKYKYFLIWLGFLLILYTFIWALSVGKIILSIIL